MQRREFLTSSMAALAGVGLAASPLLRAMAAETGKSPSWALGWQSVLDDTLAPLEMAVEGEIPADLNGVLLRNGPARFERGGVHVNHWFDGDGMVQRFDFANHRVTHSGQFVHTERYLREGQAGQYINHHGGTALPFAKPARNNDSLNQANIALLEWDEELLALWEGGSAYRMDLDTLTTLGRKTWRKDMENMPFSAHPLVDRDGSMWNVGFAPYGGKGGYVFIYHIAPKTGLRSVQPVALPFAGYIHDFAQSERHLALLIPPYHYQHEAGNTFVDRFVWEPQRGSRLLVLDKNDLTKQQWFEIPPGFVFHFGDAWQQGQELRINLNWYSDPSLMQSNIAQRMQDAHRPLAKQAFASTVVANMQNGRAKLVKSDTVMEFPGFEQTSWHNASSNIGVGVLQHQGRRSDALTRWEPATGHAVHYRNAEEVVAEEPLFAGPKNGQGQSKYIVQTFLDLARKQTGMNVFLSDAITQGPIACARMSRTLPLGFHGLFKNT